MPVPSSHPCSHQRQAMALLQGQGKRRMRGTDSGWNCSPSFTRDETTTPPDNQNRSLPGIHSTATNPTLGCANPKVLSLVQCGSGGEAVSH